MVRKVNNIRLFKSISFYRLYIYFNKVDFLDYIHENYLPF
jgi:hypothetical protein